MMLEHIVNIVEKEGSMQLTSPLSTEIKQALEGRGYGVTNTILSSKDYPRKVWLGSRVNLK